MCDCPGDLNKAFYTLCGATSIENAIKLARLYTGRHKILTRYQSYHGSSNGAMTASGDPRKLPVDSQQAPNFVHFDLPYLYRWEYGEEALLKESVASLERMIAYEGAGNIAAIILEGESGSSGCLKYPVGYLKLVRDICYKNGILLIMDEVMSGFGRTGKWFGFENHGIVPDMIAMAKGLTCGYLPFGCLMVSDKIAAKYDDAMLPLGLTYSAHPVSCAAAVAGESHQPSFPRSPPTMSTWPSFPSFTSTRMALMRRSRSTAPMLLMLSIIRNLIPER